MIPGRTESSAPTNPQPGGAMWASPPTHNMKVQQDGASRTPPPTHNMKVQQDGESRTPPPTKILSFIGA